MILFKSALADLNQLVLVVHVIYRNDCAGRFYIANEKRGPGVHAIAAVLANFVGHESLVPYDVGRIAHSPSWLTCQSSMPPPLLASSSGSRAHRGTAAPRGSAGSTGRRQSARADAWRETRSG